MLHVHVMYFTKILHFDIRLSYARGVQLAARGHNTKTFSVALANTCVDSFIALIYSSTRSKPLSLINFSVLKNSLSSNEMKKN